MEIFLKLSDIPTDVLVKELESRNGVTAFGCGCYGDYTSVGDLVVRKRYDRRRSSIVLPKDVKLLVLEDLPRS